MLSAGKFIFELRHFLLGAVQHVAQLIRETQIGGAAVDFRATLQLRTKPFLQLIYICPNLLEERARYAFALVQKSGKKMLVRDFGMISLRREVLRRLQRLLHLLRVFVDAHAPKYKRDSLGNCALVSTERTPRSAELRQQTRRLTQTPLQR